LEPKLELEDEERIKKVHTKSPNVTPRLSIVKKIQKKGKKERKKEENKIGGREGRDEMMKEKMMTLVKPIQVLSLVLSN